MVQFSKIPDDREELVRGYELHLDAVRDIYSGLAGQVTWPRLTLSLEALGLAASDLLLNRDRLRAAVYDYALFADCREGKTLFEQWLGQYRRQPPDSAESIEDRIVDALAASQFSVFEIEAIEHDLVLLVRDLFSEERMLVLDRRATTHWQAGDTFAGRLIVLPGFAMLASEPIEAAVSLPTERSEGHLSRDDRARLQAAVIGAFADALRAEA